MYFFRTQLVIQSLKPLAVCAGIWLAVQANLASAAIVTGFGQPGFGAAALVSVTLDDMAAGPGNISVTVEVIPGPNIGDIRGVYFHISDESLVGPGNQFSVVGPDVTDSIYLINGVSRLSNGTHIQPIAFFDLGFEIGTEGIIENDIQKTMFVLSNGAVALDVSLFEQSQFGVRLSNVGVEGGPRSRLTRSKLAGTFSSVSAIPEPTAGLVCSLLAAFGFGRTTLSRTRKPTLTLK